MFAALSATNEAIMRAKSRDGTVRTGVRGRGARRQVHLDHHRPGRARQRFLDIVAAAGPDGERDAHVGCRDVGQSDPGRARALRNGVPHAAGPASPTIISATRAARAFPPIIARTTARRSGAAFPLLVDGRAGRRHAVHLARQSDTFTPEFVELLQRLADNVSFALGEFRSRRRQGQDRGPEGAPDAHVRGAERDQRSDHAGQVPRASCSNWCAKPRRTAASSPRPPSRWRSPTAIISTSSPPPGRPPPARARSEFRSTRRIRKGAGVSGTAFRSRQACIINDYLADPRSRGVSRQGAQRRRQGPAPRSRCSCGGRSSAS